MNQPLITYRYLFFSINLSSHERSPINHLFTDAKLKKDKHCKKRKKKKGMDSFRMDNWITTGRVIAAILLDEDAAMGNRGVNQSSDSDYPIRRRPAAYRRRFAVSTNLLFLCLSACPPGLTFRAHLSLSLCLSISDAPLFVAYGSSLVDGGKRQRRCVRVSAATVR